MKNATNDANKSFDQKLIDIISQQNDIIFSTRKRLFNLEKIQRRDIFFLLGMNFLICTLCILIAIKSGGFTW